MGRVRKLLAEMCAGLKWDLRCAQSDTEASNKRRYEIETRYEAAQARVRELEAEVERLRGQQCPVTSFDITTDRFDGSRTVKLDLSTGQTMTFVGMAQVEPLQAENARLLAAITAYGFDPHNAEQTDTYADEYLRHESCLEAEKLHKEIVAQVAGLRKALEWACDKAQEWHARCAEFGLSYGCPPVSQEAWMAQALHEAEVATGVPVETLTGEGGEGEWLSLGSAS